MKAIRIKDWN